MGVSSKRDLFVQFIALCYYEYLNEKLRQIVAELAVPNGEKEHDTEENLKNEKRLKLWITNNSIYCQLQWFDVVETVDVTDSLQRKRWSTEMTQRDKMYLRKLGVFD